MRQRRVAKVFWAACLLLVSCGRRVEKPEPANPGPAAENPIPAQAIAPHCSVENYRKQDFQPGIQLHVWDMRVHALKELSASLLVVREGRPQTVNKTEYKWSKWDSSEPPAAGQISLLMHDGQLFGVKDKRFPLLAVDFPKVPAGERVAAVTTISIDGPLQPRASTATNNGSLPGFPPGQRRNTILFAQLLASAKDVGTFRLSPDLAALIKPAPGDRTVVAVNLEWVPR